MRKVLVIVVSLLSVASVLAQNNYSLDGVWKSHRGDSIVVCSYSDSLHYTITSRYGRSTFHLNKSKDTLFLINYSDEVKYFLVNISKNEIKDVLRITKPALDSIVVFKKNQIKLPNTTSKKTWAQSFFNFNTDYHNAGLLYQYPCYYFPFTMNRDFIAQRAIDSLVIEWYEDPSYDLTAEIVNTAEITYYFDSFGNIIRCRIMNISYGVPELYTVWKYTYKDQKKGILDHIYFPDTYIYFQNNWELMNGKVIKMAPKFVPVEWQYNAAGQPIKFKSFKFETTYTYNALQQMEGMHICGDTSRPLNIESFEYRYNATGMPVKIIKVKP